MKCFSATAIVICGVLFGCTGRDSSSLATFSNRPLSNDDARAVGEILRPSVDPSKSSYRPYAVWAVTNGFTHGYVVLEKDSGGTAWNDGRIAVHLFDDEEKESVVWRSSLGYKSAFGSASLAWSPQLQSHLLSVRTADRLRLIVTQEYALTSSGLLLVGLRDANGGLIPNIYSRTQFTRGTLPLVDDAFGYEAMLRSAEPAKILAALVVLAAGEPNGGAASDRENRWPTYARELAGSERIQLLLKELATSSNQRIREGANAAIATTR